MKKRNRISGCSSKITNRVPGKQFGHGNHTSLRSRHIGNSMSVNRRHFISRLSLLAVLSLAAGCHRGTDDIVAPAPGADALTTTRTVMLADVPHGVWIKTQQQGTRCAWESWSPDGKQVLFEVITKDVLPGSKVDGNPEATGKSFVYNSDSGIFTPLNDSVHGPFAWLPNGKQFVARSSGMLGVRTIAWFKVTGGDAVRSVQLPRNLFGVTSIVTLRNGADVAFAAQSAHEESVYYGIYRTAATEVSAVAEHSSTPAFGLVRRPVKAGDQLNWLTLETNGLAVTLNVFEAIADDPHATSRRVVLDPDIVKKAADEDFTIAAASLANDTNKAAVVVRASKYKDGKESGAGTATCYMVNAEEGSASVAYTAPRLNALIIPRWTDNGKHLNVVDYSVDPPKMEAVDGTAPAAIGASGEATHKVQH